MLLTRPAYVWSVIKNSIAVMLIVIVYSACQIPPLEETRAISSTTPLLTPYFTPTPSPTDSPGILNTVTVTPRPTPTATPFIYVVVQGDTLLGIAMRYGVDLAELMNANPEVNPRILSIGTELIIPESGELREAFLNPTPIPMNMKDAVCYRTADGGQWCFVNVENNRQEAVENVMARISLLDSSGNLVAETEATTPLNVIGGFQSIPITAYFPPPLPFEVIPHLDVIGVLPLFEDDDRYLKVTIELEQETFSKDTLQASVSGSISLSGGQDEASLVWLVVVAYDDAGVVVGVRKWEALYSEDDEIPPQIHRLAEPLRAGEPLLFEVELYSLGPLIASIEVFVEARR
jgi:LysM repeat protein